MQMRSRMAIVVFFHGATRNIVVANINVLAYITSKK